VIYTKSGFCSAKARHLLFKESVAWTRGSKVLDKRMEYCQDRCRHQIHDARLTDRLLACEVSYLVVAQSNEPGSEWTQFNAQCSFYTDVQESEIRNGPINKGDAFCWLIKGSDGGFQGRTFGCSGEDGCCKPSNLCREGEGDCNWDEDCEGDLKCGLPDFISCVGPGFTEADRCCVRK